MKEKDAIYVACTTKDIKVPTKENTRKYYFNGLMTVLFAMSDELDYLHKWLETGERPAEIAIDKLGNTPCELIENILKDLAEMRNLVSAMRKGI